MNVPAAERQEHRKTIWPAKKELFGLMYSPTDYEQAVEAIVAAARSGVGGIVSCHSAHAAVTFSATEQLRTVVNAFDMVTPDGQPVRWALNWIHAAGLPDRVYGPELMARLCQRAATDGLRVYLYGGSDQQVLAQLKQNLESRFPGLLVVGTHSPPFRELSDSEAAAVVEQINGTTPDIVFIGLGCPKQDLFAHRHRQAIRAVMVCVGAAFDFHAGVKPMAPPWMQRRGLEWLFRLVHEPGRLGRRYVTTNTRFLLKLVPYFFKRGVGPRVGPRS